MPLYKFSCSGCQHKFGKMLSAPLAQVPCPQCGPKVMAKRVLSSPQVQVEAKASALPSPTATGVSSTDYDLDLAVGRSSREGWKVIEARQDRKQELLAAAPEGTSGKSLVRTLDHDYEVRPQDKTAESVSLQERIRPMVNQMVKETREAHGSLEGSREWDIRSR